MLGDEFPFFTSSDRFKLLDDKSLDAVFVLTPVETHTEYACDALQRGKPVFVEKPPGVNYTDVKHGYETAEKFQTPLLTGFMRRFDPAVQATVQTVQQGDIGNIHVITLVTRDSPRPSYEYLSSLAKNGCNIFCDLTPHDIDLMVWLTGAERPESIYLTGHAHDPVMKEAGEADTVTAVLKYRSGVVASINNVIESVYGYDIRFEVFGSAGMAQMDNPRLSSAKLELTSGFRSPRICTSFPDRFSMAFQNELEHFINCVDGTESPLITKEQCLMTTEIIDRGTESFQQGGVIRFQ
ncbi:LOW QUALITY PROTEIN: myo-inositol 2-dehydrogenase-like [Haliotis rubra]|uniref:LOW QUALITY PROTEIN: myo-inositol 2-dehydrogenase-like n=1 Tax=Haliotis rubra TaxID=36100 RepID=UPI001EE52837|nr:LOW QUALITY PROTEIN: myo-inositol 2-dehydrogenase-like [Haliotis rubra]